MNDMKFRLHGYILIAAIAVPVIAGLLIYSSVIKLDIEENKTLLPRIEDVPAEYWTKLAEKRIFFGHQTIGNDIIDGITEIIEEHNYVKLNIVETSEPTAFDRPVFAHTRIGYCRNPASKITCFEAVIENGVGNKVDIAFLKLCHIDVRWESDIRSIFDDYQKTIKNLQLRYPEIKFLHVTVPVCSRPKGVKRILRESIKLLIGRAGIWDDNIKRHRYNEFLNNAYSKTESVFDLALVESVNPGGFRCYITGGTEKVFVLAPEYAFSIGNLNHKGGKRIAEQLLITLAQTAGKF